MDAMSDDVLGLVLERVSSHVSLIRAAAVCRRWRRTITDAAFLRRYRSLHAPAVFEDYHNVSPLDLGAEAGTSGPVFARSSSSTVDTRHFSLDFLPDDAGPWNILDSRGSLLLMNRRGFRPPFPDMVVCEPLTRRRVAISPPADLGDGSCFLLQSFLVDGCTNASGRISMSNFRVLCLLYSGGHRHVYHGR
ncbi:unnamed protein product [Urochloa humidicola]